MDAFLVADGDMVRDDLLENLRCPDDRSRLVSADAALVAEVNAQIRLGRLRNRAGRRLDRAIDGGLVRAGGDLLYPILDQIPLLLQDEAIPLDQLDR